VLPLAAPRSAPRRFSFSSPPTLYELLPVLTPIERSFFTALDVELNKVEKFYLDREQEMNVRSRLLEEQLEELVEHRRLFYVRSMAQPCHLTGYTLTDVSDPSGGPPRHFLYPSVVHSYQHGYRFQGQDPLTQIRAANI
jgi:hypothetical protein